MGFETIINELSVIFAGVAILSTLFLFLKQPIIIAYVGLGMIAGPFGLRYLDNVEHIEHISHPGIILLLFLIGLNLHPNKLASLFKKTALTTTLTRTSFFLVFGLLAFAFKFSIRESVVVGIALMFSSTIVGLKLIPTTTLHQKRLGELMVSVLLLQDIIAIIVIILLGGSSEPNFHFYILQPQKAKTRFSSSAVQLNG
ncbi:MAG: cation:proton antiporter [Chitinispirillaceae bacterium]|nr:cation:proton antiporter [Chitinispirillaceae bacterium]